MEETNKIKISFIAFFTVMAGWIGILAVPVIILVVFNIIDYITGLVASKYRGERITSYKSFRGIAKKVCQWLLIVIAAFVDWLIIFAGETIGLELPLIFLIACATAIWLLFNEIVSIIENMKDIGADIPPFLEPLAKNIKKQVEDKATIKGDEDND